ncbi:MAG: thiamine diphosphokinase [Lachnospiraceae bacterium]|nr:thiamine diphosphokinase [Lachnospiraceae bacterium]
MKRCVIVGGADIKDVENIRSYLRDDDFFIFCDSGLKHMEGLNVKPDLIVGDFDSHENPNLSVETIVLPCEKDDTDSFFAAKQGLKRDFDEFLLIGVIGQRIDHTLANISILLMLDKENKKAKAVDDYSELEIASDETVYVEDKYAYFSLLNITGTARDITIKGAKYPLDDGEINVDYQYGVSNEVLPGQTAEITVGEGKLLLVKVF